MLRPTVFGQLCLLERISVGGMAEVYRAKPFNVPDVDRYLAVKRILPNLAEDDEFINMFVDEAKIAIRLNHPNICKIYELGRLAESPYIVMEFIAGQDILSIQKRLRQKRRVMAVSQAVFVAARMADALYHSHNVEDEEGRLLELVHRDVSPQNILVSYAGDVKLIDFGIAKVATQSTETRVGVLKGKFSYMSPEQVTGSGIDARADLFALGTVLYEMLTGRRLFHGESDFHTLEQVREARISPPSTLNSLIPEALDQIVLKALGRLPADRFQDGQAMAAALESFLEDAGAPYSKSDLSDWMVENFETELELERSNREQFKQFVTPEDVQTFNREQLATLRASLATSQSQVQDASADFEHTQVATASLDQLLASGMAERGEIIAENVLESLPRRIADAQKHLLSDIDLPEPREPEHDSEMFRHHHRRSIGLLVVIPVLIALLAAGGVYVGSLFRSEGPVESVGMLIVESNPADQVQVFLDGALVETATPAALRDVPSGEHTIEIRHEDYETYLETVLVEPGMAPKIEAELLRLPTGPGELALTVIPSDAEVWLDGRLLEDSDSVVEITSRTNHTVEVRRDGYFVLEHHLTILPGESRTLDAELMPTTAQLSLESVPPGRVFLDDVELGSTEDPLLLQDLDPYSPHRLRIEPIQLGYRVYETTLLLEAITESTRIARLTRVGEEAAERDFEVGFVTVTTPDDWFRVFLDGRDTGLTTPIEGTSPLALRTGDRRISLVRREHQVDLLVPVSRDEITAVDCSHSEWDCGLP